MRILRPRKRGVITTVEEKVVAEQAGKSLLGSKTFWVNALAGGVATLTALGSITFLPAAVVPWVATALAIANILLRAITGQPITSLKG